MRIAFVLAAASLVATPVAAQGARAEICIKGEDRRVIEIATPGTVGAACDVVYRRSGGAEASIPYFANADKDYCRAKAAELSANLATQGFACAVEESLSIEAALEGGAPAPEPVVDAQSLDAQLTDIMRVEASDLSLAAAETVATPTETPAVSIEAPQIANDRLAVAPTVETPSAVAMSEPLAQPAPHAASIAAETQIAVPAEPVQLARDVRTSEFRAPEPPKTSGAGRLVGAQPAIGDIDDIIEDPAKPVVSAEAAAEANAKGVPARDTEDMIRNIFAANAAAWNEGNLDAYMRGYVNSADIIFVEDAVVTAGLTPLRKSFEKEVAATGEMGRLSFIDLDVRMTTEAVATVVGKYSLVRATGEKYGVVTITMNQIDGRWRIAQETRIATAKPAK